MILANTNFTITYHDEDEKDKIESLLKDILNSSTQITCNTSGSTGKPKKIVHSKASLAVSAKKTISYLDLKENESAALCLSVNHIDNLISSLKGRKYVVRFKKDRTINVLSYCYSNAHIVITHAFILGWRWLEWWV